jgi:hypothetical protein
VTNNTAALESPPDDEQIYFNLQYFATLAEGREWLVRPLVKSPTG